MNLEQVLTQILQEKGVLSVELFGLNFFRISVLDATGNLKMVDIFRDRCAMPDVLTAIRQHTAPNQALDSV